MVEMLLGRILVPDISHPRPEDVDTEFLRLRLSEMRRFSGHPDALTVSQHQRLCGLLAQAHGLAPSVIEWAEHHDDHEYATGDIATPMQRVFGIERIRLIQARWDVAICYAQGLAFPNEDVRSAVDVVDRLALALEWRWCLERDVAELGVADRVVREAEDGRFMIDLVLA